MKKQSTLKRALALGMSATMVGATLAGCGGSASSTAATSTETASSAATEAEATTDSDKPFAGTTLTWYTTLNGNVSDNFANLGDTPWAKYVEEQTGITIEFQHPTQGSEAEEFAVMLASGEYPDIIEYTWTTYSGGAGAAINDGVIISLDDYMADATNLSKVIQEHPEIGKMIKSSGGNYYCFPCLRGLESPNKTEFSSGFLYRADALKELGFDQVPETIDEWEEVLRAAKAAGYSKPFTTRKEWVKDVWSAAYDNWGSFYVDDGVVKNGLIEDSRKDFIQKMADWYAEGLLDNDWMQADKKSTQTDFVSGNCILGYAPFGQGLGNYTKAMMEADPNFKEDYIQAAAPVTSTKGKNAKFSKMNNIYDQSGASAAISSQCKNVKAAVWLLDWLYSEEGQICYNFGIEGESYEMKDGKPVYTDLIMNNPDGMSVAQALAAYTRASTSGAGIQSEDYIDQYYAQDNQKKALELSMKTDMGEHMFPPTSVSEENQDRYSEIMSQVKTLADEMEASFICGTTPMSEWDSYQQKLKDAGIEEAGVKIPLYGGGGVFNYENAARILMAGSEMVQLGALACAGGTMACKKLISDLNRWMDENGYADMDSLVGDSLKLFQMDADFTKKRQNKLADAYQTADADRTKCIGCGRCEDVCWHQGIEIKDRKAYKTDKCIGCGYCFQVCPTQALYVDKKGILRSAFEEAGIRRGNK